MVPIEIRPNDDLRDKLALLCIHDGTCFPHCFPDSPPLFSAEELSREPLKWLKYLVMDRVGLEPISKISSQIKRFSLSNVDSAKNWVYKHLSIPSSREMRRMIVAKVVPWDCGAQLKNYRMFSPEEIEPTFQELLDDFPDATHELWCCESPIGKEGFNIGGRLNFPKGSKNQVLELVWFASPRFIERVQLPDFEYPYLRAVRNPMKPEFSIEVLHVPKDYAQSYDQKLWIEDFQWLVRELAAKRRAMEILISTLYAFGAREVCFCFKVTEGHLTIIDWDTEIESSIR
jgi:hypothetical protein